MASQMVAIAMVTKVQKMLNSLQTADPFKIFKMAANIKIKKIVKNSKMSAHLLIVLNIPVKFGYQFASS
jgi:hypothetical protein